MNVQDNSTRRTAGRVAFLSLKDEIRKAIEAGWALSVVYDNFKDRLPIQYGQFRSWSVQRLTSWRPPRLDKPGGRSRSGAAIGWTAICQRTQTR